MVIFIDLDEALEEFAVNGGKHMLEICFTNTRDGKPFQDRVTIQAEDILSFKIIQPLDIIADWKR